MANGPIKRITLKSREADEDGEHTFITLLAGWDGDYGTRWTLDGRVKGISIKYEDAAGKVRTVHVPTGSREDPCPFYFNEYDNDNGGKKGKKGKGKGKGKRRDEDDEDDFGGDDIPF